MLFLYTNKRLSSRFSIKICKNLAITPNEKGGIGRERDETKEDRNEEFFAIWWVIRKKKRGLGGEKVK